MKKFTLLSLSFLIAQSALAVPVVTSWTNPECETGNCEVKSLKVHVDRLTSKTFMGNSGVIEIEASSKELLSKYGIVQYIKGCQYEITSKGVIKMSSRSKLGKSGMPFLHKDWEVDSGDDVDPIYWSYDSAGYDDLRGFDVPRNSGYVNANPHLTDKYSVWGGKPKNLKESKIFMQDQPSPATWKLLPDLSQQSTVTSLQFRSCVYEMSKIPREITDPSIQFADPIGCVEWSSNFSYDFAKRKFVEQKEISQVCR